jgi:spore coat protein A
MNRWLASPLAGLLMLAVGVQVAVAQVGTQVPLNPANIPQFVDPLPHFAGLRVAATSEVYVKAVPHQQRAVSTGTVLAAGATGMANLWVYRLSTDNSSWTPPLWPAFTIDATRGQALNVHYANELGGQTYADVGLVVDPTLHAADPLMGNMYTLNTQPPITVHLHGGEVPPWSDGGPDSWFMPGNPPSPRGHAYVTNVYSYPNTQEAATLWYHDHVLGATRLNVYAGMAGFYLLRDPNENSLKLPGFSGDDLVQEVAPVGASGVFNPNPYLPEIEIAIQDRMFDDQGRLYFPNLPTNPAFHPSWTPEFVGDVITVNGKTWPYMSVAPRKYRVRLLNGSNARFYNLSFPGNGPTITQIGTDGGFLDVPVALGRGPLLLAPGERADLIIDFTGLGPKKNGKISTYILNNDAKTPFPGGANVNPKTTGRIMQFVVNGTMVSAADPANAGADKSIIPTALKTNVKLTNFAGAPAASVPVTKVRELTLNEVMAPGGPVEILVNNTKWSGLSVAPEFGGGTGVRADFSPVADVPGDPNTDFTYYSETMQEGETEIWQIINLTADAHPIHLHLVQFQLMSRQTFKTGSYNTAYNALFPASAAIDPMTGLAYPGGVFIGGYGPPLAYTSTPPVLHPTFGVPTVGGNPDVTPYLQGPMKTANPNERGWKDTFIMYPGEVTTVIARWAPTDKPATDPASSLYFGFNPDGGHGYVWHCHIIDHEDNEMMRPYNVVANANAVRASSSALAQEIAVVAEKPVRFALDQNYPNPFNPTTEIRFAIPENSHVVLKLYNALGQEVQTLVDNEVSAGNHAVRLNASRLATGTYFYRLQAGNNVAIKKMMLVK